MVEKIEGSGRYMRAIFAIPVALALGAYGRMDAH